MGNDDRPDGLTADAEPPGHAGRKERHVPERKCVLSGEKAPRMALVRLALGPDGSVAPDVRAKAGGRGAWIGVDRATLETAIAKGRLKGGLARAFKTATFTIPDDLPDRIEEALRRATLDRLGLEARAGTLLTGSEKIAEAARRGNVAMLIHAADAAADGNRKLDQALRVGREEQGSGARGLVIPANRAILSMALGRENVVHIALIVPAAAARVAQALGRWCDFIGRDDGDDPCDMGSQGPSALRDESEGFGC
ncbi:DUF448 domain-containing protein [Sphingomonas solaris]|uniref:DUF448 domain-containing protein n=1 Tax=Alterirhizorhabdus solaris TaxID=2529389 RepID=A0A558R7A6_9SPHN|nr:DUF448 domain-containing protein [Sphingomonas solaris]TVV75264.1 DUF448 domain-containing protein [Sphingomonas solaris]